MKGGKCRTSKGDGADGRRELKGDNGGDNVGGVE